MIQLELVIGKEVLKILPTSIDGKESIESEDNVLAQGAGIAGLNVTRKYGTTSSETESIEFNLVNNSPMLKMINSMLSNPLMMSAGGMGQKMVRIQGYKALIETGESETGETESVTIQVPFGDSLITVEFNKYTDENQAIALVDEIKIGEIVKLVGQN